MKAFRTGDEIFLPDSNMPRAVGSRNKIWEDINEHGIYSPMIKGTG